MEIAKALLTEPRVLILDEPTSALEASSSQTLLEVVRVLREREVAVVFVSHILAEVMEVCDEVTVLRDGSPVMEGRARSDLSVGAIVDAMLGEQPASGSGDAPSEEAEKLAEEIKLRPAEEGEAGALELSDVSGGPLHGVSLRAKPGEIVGLAGVAGAGHLTVFELVSGLRRADGGEITLPGGRSVPRGLRRAIGGGVALV